MTDRPIVTEAVTAGRDRAGAEYLAKAHCIGIRSAMTSIQHRIAMNPLPPSSEPGLDESLAS